MFKAQIFKNMGSWWRLRLLNGHRLLYVIFSVSLLYGLFIGQLLFVSIALLFLLLCALADIWYSLYPNHLHFKLTLSTQRAHIGETITIDFLIINTLPLPLPWLEFRTFIAPILEPLDSIRRNDTTHQFFWLSDVLSLKPGQQLTYSHHLFCTGRGSCTLRRVMVRTSDPVGWFVHSRYANYKCYPELLIYPLVAPLSDLNLPAFLPFGEMTTSRRLVADPLRVAGVRAYQIGDDTRLIHWKVSARMGDLHSKVLEDSGTYRFMVLMDVKADADSDSSIDDDLLELHVTAAASIVQWAIDEDYLVGMLANARMLDPAAAPQNGHSSADTSASSSPATPYSDGLTDDTLKQVLWVAPDRRENQSERILTSLTRIEPLPNLPIEDLIELYRYAFVSGTTLVLVSTLNALRPSMIEALMDLRHSGIAAYLVLSGSKEMPLPIQTYDLPIYRIGGKEVWHALIKQARSNYNARQESPLPAL